MHKDTGQVKEFESREKVKLAINTDKWIEVDKVPDANCSKCYGRGHRGRDVTTNEYIPCKCTKVKKK